MENDTTVVVAENSAAEGQTTQNQEEQGVSVEQFLSSFAGENTAEDATETEADKATEEETTEEDDDIDFTLEEAKTDEFGNDVETIASIAGALESQPELKAAFETLVSDFSSRETGFQKLHEQVTAVRDISGRQSLQEVVDDYQKFFDPLASAFAGMRSSSTETRDGAIKWMVERVAECAGLNADEIYEIAADVSSPESRNQEITREDALRVLGLDEDAVAEATMLRGSKDFIAKFGSSIASLSKRLGFDIDPVLIYQTKQKHPTLPDASLIREAYPKEMDGFIASKAKRDSAKQDKIAKAPILEAEGPLKGKPDLNKMTPDELASFISKQT